MPGRTAQFDLTDAKEWIDMYTDIETCITGIKTTIYQRNQKLAKQMTSSKKADTSIASQNAKTRREIRTIRADLGELTKSLSKLGSEISPQEISRRKDDVDNLVSEIDAIEKDFSVVPQANSKKNMLFDSNGNSTEEPDHIKGLNDEQVLDYQDHMLKVQDKGLDMLSNALDRTKKIGEAIGNEIDDQAPLIKKLGNEVEDADKALQRQTKKIENMMRKAKLPCAVFVIIFLLVAIAILFGVALFVNINVYFKL